MQYLVKANQIVCSGDKEILMQYISNSHKTSIKEGESANWRNDYANFESFIEALGYTVKNEFPSNCKIEGTTITGSQFMRTWKECNYNISETSLKLKLAEQNVKNIIRKMNLKR